MKFNPLLDKFPTEYNGIKMNTDFRVGILLSLLFNSGKFSDEEKKLQALSLLYGDNFAESGVDIIDLWKGVEWFISVGYNKCINTVDNKTNDKDDDEDDDESLKDKDGNDLIFTTEYKEDDGIIDFEFDASRIYTAFLRTYGVDLTEVKMHFFKFMFMLSDLDSDCSESKVIDIRQTNLKDMDKKQRAAYIKLKKVYAIPTELDEESKAKLSEVGLDESDLEQFMQF